LRAIIVGGGIGGLTAALCLGARGWTVEVLEQTRTLSEVLTSLGLKPALNQVGFEPQALEMRMGQSGRTVFSIPMAQRSEDRWGECYLHILRSDLQSVLVEALEARSPGALKLDCPVQGYENRGSECRIVMDSGEVRIADLVVAADGIHSLIRDQMCGAIPPRFTGNVAWRMVVPTDLLKGRVPPPTACVWVGPGRHAVTYRLRGGALTNLVGVVERADWLGESWFEEGAREEAQRDFAAFHPVIQELIEQAPSHGRWALFDRHPLGRWTDDRVALLGDACHPTLPFMAQGAVMAMEDAFVLAKAVSGSSSVPQGLLDYQALRMPRTSALQAAAVKNMSLFHRKSAISQALTYAPMWLGAKLFPDFVHSRQDWIYGHDVTRSI